MLKGVNEAPRMYKGLYTIQADIIMNFSIAPFTASLYLNKNNELTFTNQIWPVTFSLLFLIICLQI